MTWLLNHFGEREWSVFRWAGSFHAQPTACTRDVPADRFIRSNLTKAAAQHLARKLRYRDQESPRDVMRDSATQPPRSPPGQSRKG